MKIKNLFYTKTSSVWKVNPISESFLIQSFLMILTIIALATFYHIEFSLMNSILIIVSGPPSVYFLRVLFRLIFKPLLNKWIEEERLGKFSNYLKEIDNNDSIVLIEKARNLAETIGELCTVDNAIIKYHEKKLFSMIKGAVKNHDFLGKILDEANKYAKEHRLKVDLNYIFRMDVEKWYNDNLILVSTGKHSSPFEACLNLIFIHLLYVYGDSRQLHKETKNSVILCINDKSRKFSGKSAERLKYVEMMKEVMSSIVKESDDWINEQTP